MGGLVAVNTNRAEDRVRPADGRGSASVARERRTEGAAAGSGAEFRSDSGPLAGSGRRWSVRVHWGIIFAIVASAILWLAIRSVVGLAF